MLDLLINTLRTCNGQIIFKRVKNPWYADIGNNLHGREIVKVCSMILVEKRT